VDPVKVYFAGTGRRHRAYAIWLAAHDLGLGACWINPNFPVAIKAKRWHPVH